MNAVTVVDADEALRKVKRRRWAAGAAIFFWIAVAAFATMLFLHPFQRMLAPVFLVALLSSFVAINRTLAYVGIRLQLDSEPAFALTWGGAIALSLLMSRGLGQLPGLHERMLAGRAAAPLIEHLEAGIGQAQTAEPSRIAAALGSASVVPSIEIRFVEAGYLLTVPGGSFDIDGSTLYFDRRDRRWRTVPGPEYAAFKFDLIPDAAASRGQGINGYAWSGFLQCRPASGAWSCATQ